MKADMRIKSFLESMFSKTGEEVADRDVTVFP